MDKKKPSKEVNQQQQAAKKKGSFAAYAASGRLERNRRRRIEKEQRRQARAAETRPYRVYLRKVGAASRLQRRLWATTNPREREQLAHSLSKAVTAGEAAYEAYLKASA